VETTDVPEQAADPGLIEIAERVLKQRLTTAYDLASAACPDEEQRKGIDFLWLHIGQSYGKFRYLAECIAKAHAEGQELASELGVHG
jgi:hypothetical protein